MNFEIEIDEKLEMKIDFARLKMGRIKRRRFLSGNVKI
jgi:hypothetical protein